MPDETPKKVVDASQLLKALNLSQQPATVDTTASATSAVDPWGTDLNQINLDDIFGDKQPEEPDKPRVGLLKSINLDLTQGILNTAEGLTETPQFGEAIKQFGIKTLADAVINRKVKKGELTPEQGETEKARTKEYLPKFDFFGIPHKADAMLPGTKMAEGKVNEYLHEQVKLIGEENNRYDKTMSQYFKEGDYGNAIGATVSNIAQSLPPTLLAAFFPAGGAALLGTTTGAQTYDEVKDREDMTEANKVIDGISTGIFEWFFEWIGSAQMVKGLEKAYIKYGAEAVESKIKESTLNVISKYYKKFGVWFAPVHEGLSEVLTTIGQNITAKMTGEDPDRKPWDNAWESLAAGAGTGGIFAGFQKLTEALSQRQSKASTPPPGGPSQSSIQGTPSTPGTPIDQAGTPLDISPLTVPGQGELPAGPVAPEDIDAQVEQHFTPISQQMEQFRSRDDGQLHMYQDNKGQMFYMLEQVDENTGMFVSAETPEGLPAPKSMKGLSVMQHLQDITWDDWANGIKENLRMGLQVSSQQAQAEAAKPEPTAENSYRQEIASLNNNPEAGEEQLQAIRDRVTDDMVGGQQFSDQFLDDLGIVKPEVTAGTSQPANLSPEESETLTKAEPKTFPVTFSDKKLLPAQATEQPNGTYLIDQTYPSYEEAEKVRGAIEKKFGHKGYTATIESQSTDESNPFADEIHQIRINTKPAAPKEEVKKEETAPVKKQSGPGKELKAKRQWPMSKADEGRILQDPQNFAMAVYQFFLAGGRVKTDDLIRYAGIKPGTEEFRRMIWAYSNNGISLDVINEIPGFEQFMGGMTGPMDAINAFIDVMQGVSGKNSIRDRFDAMINNQGQAPEVSQEEINQQEQTDSDEIVIESNETIVANPEIMTIFMEFSDENGEPDFEKLIAKMGSDPEFFKYFPFELTDEEFNNFLTDLKDVSKQSEFRQQFQGSRQTQIKTQRDELFPGSTEYESRTGSQIDQGQSGTEKAEVQPAEELTPPDEEPPAEELPEDQGQDIELKREFPHFPEGERIMRKDGTGPKKIWYDGLTMDGQLVIIRTSDSPGVKFEGAEKVGYFKPKEFEKEFVKYEKPVKEEAKAPEPAPAEEVQKPTENIPENIPAKPEFAGEVLKLKPVEEKPIEVQPITKPLTKAQEKKQASDLGKAAFEAGKPRVPIHDPALVVMLAGKAAGTSSPILQAWLDAWDKANLAAPVPENMTPKEVQLQNEEIKPDPNPTEGQQDQGNYQKGHISLQGMQITIENGKGSMRKGTDPSGKPWLTVMNNTYGYFPNTRGADFTKETGRKKDYIDVFIGPNLNPSKVFIIDQVNPDTQAFDEHKVMLGFDSQIDAQNAYLSNYTTGWRGFGAISEMPIDEFKTWLYDGKAKLQPLAYNKPDKLVSNDRMDELRRKMREKLGKPPEDILQEPAPGYTNKFDPEMFAMGAEMAAFHIESGNETFEDFARLMIEDLGPEIKPYLKSFYNGARDFPGLDNSKMTGYDKVSQINLDDIEKVINLPKISEDAQRQSGYIEPGSTGADSAIPDNQAPVPVIPGPGGQGAEELERGVTAIDTDTEAGLPGGDTGNVVRGDLASLFGQPGDIELHPEKGGLPVTTSTPADNDTAAGRKPDKNGNRPDTAGRKDTGSDVQQRTPGIPPAPIVKGSLESIKQSLPLLLPDQHDDVLKTETRFFTGAHQGRGMLFTNATGTGKTYSGLGIIARTLARVKEEGNRVANILIVVPSDQKMIDWARTGAKFPIEIKGLESTKDKGGAGTRITTYANFTQNDAIKSVEWDLIVYDESHRLMADQKGKESGALQAHRLNANHPRYALDRQKELNGLWKQEKQVWKEYHDAQKPIDQKYHDFQLSKETWIKLSQDQSDIRDTKLKPINEAQEQVLPELERKAKEAQERTKVVFLSATPFNSHKTLEYVDQFVINMGSDDSMGGAYNAGSARDLFFVQNFGYRMRYNKLTEPDSDVDVPALERLFFDKLVKQGAISGRALMTDFDYSREFPIVLGDYATQFNDIYSHLNDHAQYKHLSKYVHFKFYNNLYSNQLFENLKSGLVVQRINKHLDLGRKVVVFHRYVNSGRLEHPFDFDNAYYEYYDSRSKSVVRKFIKDDKKALEELERFKELCPGATDIQMDLRSPIAQLQEGFGDKMVIFNGKESKSVRRQNLIKFNTPHSGTDVLLIQEMAGREGIDLHDITGEFQRVIINLALPVSPITALQVEGRINRIGLQSNAIFEYPILGLSVERYHFGNKINNRVGTTENLAMGSKARDLRRAFKDGFLNADIADPSNDQGTGGKEFDKANTLERDNPYTTARAFYFTNLKKTSKNKSSEGIDYYATPEPVGFKMVEWSGLQRGGHMLEPSAGHGAIARFAPDGTNLTAIEPSMDLMSLLSVNAEGRLVNGRFEDLDIHNKYDAVVMNPPFGTAGKTAAEHLEKAFSHLKQGGRVVALLPSGPSMEKRIDRMFSEDENGNLAHLDIYHRTIIHMPSVTFNRAGTSVATDIHIFDRVSQEQLRAGGMTKEEAEQFIDGLGINYPSEIDLRHIQDINKLFDTIENITVADKIAIPVRKETQAEKDLKVIDDLMSGRGGLLPGRPASNLQQKEAGAIAEVITQKHTQTGDAIFTVRLLEQVSSDKFSEFKRVAKTLGGYWSSFRGGGTLPGFLFKSMDNATRMAQQLNDNNNDQVREGDIVYEDLFGNRTPIQSRMHFPMGPEPGTIEQAVQIIPKKPKRRTEPKKVGLQPGEFSLMEVKSRVDGGITFNGTAEITGPQDVAFLLRDLQTASVEHVIIVGIQKDGSPSIFHHSTGGPASSLLDVPAVTGFVKQGGFSEIYMVHNHPSGQLNPSPADYAIASKLNDLMAKGKVKVTYVINDVDSGKYSVFTPTGKSSEGVTGDYNALNMLTELDAEKRGPLKDHAVLKFDRQVFSSDVEFLNPVAHLAEERPNGRLTVTIRNSGNVAQFVSGMRLSTGDKLGVLIINQGNQIVASYFLPTEWSVDKTIFELTAMASRHNGRGVILYDNRDQSHESARTSGASHLRVTMLSNLSKAVKVLDYVSVPLDVNIDVNRYTTKDRGYYSAADEGDIQEPAAEYKSKAIASLGSRISSLEDKIIETVRQKELKKQELSKRINVQQDLFAGDILRPKAEQSTMFDVKQDASQENIEKILQPFDNTLARLRDELTGLRNQMITAIKEIQGQGMLFDEGSTYEVNEPAKNSLDRMTEIGKLAASEGYIFEVDADLDPDFTSLTIFDREGLRAYDEDLPKGIKELADEFTNLMHESGVSSDDIKYKITSRMPLDVNQEAHVQFIQDITDELKAKAPGASRTVVIPRVVDIPDYLHQNGEKPGTISDVYKATRENTGLVIPAFYSRATDTVYFIAQNSRYGTADDRAMVIENWLHEQIGHHGMMLLYPSRADRTEFLDNLYKEVGKAEIDKVIGEGYEDLSDAGRAEEYLAYLTGKVLDGETLTTREKTIWQKILDYFRKLWDKLTGKNSSNYDVARVIHAMLTKVMAPPQVKPQSAPDLLYHGSGHDFSSFQSDRINTGMQALDNGYGIYLTTEPQIAQFYAEQVAAQSSYFKKALQDLGDKAPILNKALFYSKGSNEGVVRWLQDKVDTYSDDGRLKAKYQDVLKYLDENPLPELRHIYINALHLGRTPDQWQYLERYKTVTTDQINKINATLIHEGYQQVNRMTGKMVYERLSDMMGGDKAASEFLLRAGIDGLKYPASQLIDGSGTGYNYVVFDASEVMILEHVAFRKVPVVSEAKMIKTRADYLYELFVQKMASVEKLQDLIVKRGGKITDTSNVTMVENAAASAAKAKMDNYQRDIFSPLLNTIGRILERTGKLNTTDAVDNLDKYLRAKHSPERNAYMEQQTGREQNADFPTAEAEKIVADYEANLTPEEIESLWKGINAATDFTLKKQLESGFMDQERYDAIKAMGYNHYVPLRGWKDEIHDLFDYQESDRNASTAYQGLVKAKGRTSESAFVLSYIQSMANTAIVAGEKNKIKQAAAEMVLQNKAMKDLFKFMVVYTVDTGQVDADGNPITYETVMKPEQDLWDADQVKISKSHSHEVRRPKWMSKQHEVQLFMNGQRVILLFTDPNIANAINNQNSWQPEVTRGFQQTIGKMTRWMSANFTAKNPAFMPINQIRDLGYAVMGHAIKYGTAMQFMGNLPRARRAIIRATQGKADLTSNPEDQMYEQWRVNGGETGYVHLEEIKDIEKQVIKHLERALGINGKWDKATQTWLLREGGKLLENLAKRSENLSRYATFLTSMQNGRSVLQSVNDSKEITVNFNTKGRITAILGAMYGFFNAGTQGGYNFYKLGKKGAKSFTLISAGFMAMGFLSALLANLWSDDDENGDSAYDALGDFIKENNLVIPTGARGFITIPMPFGFRMFFAWGVLANEFAYGKKPAAQVLTRGLSSIGEAFSPVNPTGFFNREGGITIRPLVPMAFSPMYDIAVNEDFAGRRLFQEPFTLAQEKSLAESQRGLKYVSPYIKAVTDKMYSAAGGDELKEKYYFDPEGKKVHRVFSLMDINPSKVEHLFDSYLGGRFQFWNQAVTTSTDLIIGAAKATQSKDLRDIVDKVPLNTVPVLRRLYQEPWQKPYWNKYFQYREDLTLYKNLMGQYGKMIDPLKWRTMEDQPDMQWKINKFEASDNLIQELYLMANDRNTPRVVADTLLEKRERIVQQLVRDLVKKDEENNIDVPNNIR